MKKYILLVFLISGINCFAQNITNTLGSAGNYYIKDASSTFFTLQQSNGFLGLGVSPNQQFEISGNFRLPTTNGSIIGVIYKDGNPFIHDYKPASNQGFNTFVGINSGNFTMSGASASDASYNTAVGYQTLNSLTSGRYNTAVGSQSLSSNTSATSNTAVGYKALNGSSGGGNTAIGTNSLQNSSGSNNTAIGSGTGTSLTTGSNCTFIGSNSQASSSSATNEITLGDGNITALRCNVTTITSLSDARDKNDVEDLTLGLDFLCSLKPRQFHWNKREWYEEKHWNDSLSEFEIVKTKNDGSKSEKKWTAGFIAQELDKAQNNADANWLNLVYKNNPDKWEATYGNLLPVIVKSIQQLKEQNDKLAFENAKLKMQVAQLGDLAEQIAEVKRLKKDILEKLTEVKANNKDGNAEVVAYGKWNHD